MALLHITLLIDMIMLGLQILDLFHMIRGKESFGLDKVPRPTGSPNLKGDLEGGPYNKVIGPNAMVRCSPKCACCY